MCLGESERAEKRQVREAPCVKTPSSQSENMTLMAVYPEHLFNSSVRDEPNDEAISRNTRGRGVVARDRETANYKTCWISHRAAHLGAAHLTFLLDRSICTLTGQKKNHLQLMDCLKVKWVNNKTFQDVIGFGGGCLGGSVS